MKKSEAKKKEERIPVKCYSCGKYDGFDVKENEFVHCCHECKQLPTNIAHPISEHMTQYDSVLEKGQREAQRLLRCDRCEQERDMCRCTDNPLLEQIRDTLETTTTG